MPRKNKSENQNTYHFKVRYNDELEGEEKEKLFRTCKDIEEVFNICRQTVYNYYMGISKNKKHRTIINIEKLNPPIERYKKIMVHFD
jgi:hypothetical protein